MSVITPSTRPTASFIRELRKYESWPQSCWKMNSRTNSPATGSESSSTRA